MVYYYIPKRVLIIILILDYSKSVRRRSSFQKLDFLVNPKRNNSAYYMLKDLNFLNVLARPPFIRAHVPVRVIQVSYN